MAKKSHLKVSAKEAITVNRRHCIVGVRHRIDDEEQEQEQEQEGEEGGEETLSAHYIFSSLPLLPWENYSVSQTVWPMPTTAFIRLERQFYGTMKKAKANVQKLKNL